MSVAPSHLWSPYNVRSAGSSISYARRSIFSVTEHPSGLLAMSFIAMASFTARFALAAQLRGIRAAIAKRAQAVVSGLANPYRPELHYMRGPGPKWQQRHRSKN